jgi:uncharacterized damage-inducible protein DinB
MGQKELLISLFGYGQWVTRRLLAAATGLSQEQFVRELLPGFGSVHHTLAHLLGAEAIWLARCQGQSPKTILSPADLPTVEVIRMRWEELDAERSAYLARLDDAGLEETLRWTNMRGQAFSLVRWQVLLHCANHSTHHRSEVAAMLTELGHEPESTDLLEYYLGLAGQPWKPTPRG